MNRILRFLARSVHTSLGRGWDSDSEGTSLLLSVPNHSTLRSEKDESVKTLKWRDFPTGFQKQSKQLHCNTAHAWGVPEKPAPVVGLAIIGSCILPTTTICLEENP